MKAIGLNGVEVSSIGDAVSVKAASYDHCLREFLFSARKTAIHSVFESVINIIWDEMVMGIHCLEYYFPGCLRLAPERWRMLKDSCSSLQPGHRVLIDNGLIWVCNGEGEAVVTIDVISADSGSLHALAISRQLSLGCLRENLSRLAGGSSAYGPVSEQQNRQVRRQTEYQGKLYLLAELCSSVLFGTGYLADYPAHPFTESGKRILYQMIQSLRNQDEQALLEAAVSLVGFGSGLTPTGDDILTGFLAVNALLGPGGIGATFSRLLIGEAAKQTNPISFTYMKLASLGNISTLLFEVIESACRCEYQVFIANLLSLMRWGSSSGIDTAVGAILSLAAVVLHATQP